MTRRRLPLRIARRLALACALHLALAGSAAAAQAASAPERSLTALKDMARAGAPGLALSLMNDAQPDPASSPEQWVEWERVRIGWLEQARAWQRAIDRLSDLPPAAPEPYRRWAIAHRAALHLELGRARTTRQILRQLLWSAAPGADEEELRQWRRTVVRSYLVDGRVDDAVLALRRFDQDYPAPSVEWAVLRTRVLLRAGRPAEATERLPDRSTDELRALALLARLRAGRLEPQAAWSRARQAAEAESASPEARARFWFIAAEAAAGDSPPRHALATERAAALASALPAQEALFAVDGDALWDAWLGYARWYGNERELLIGDHEAWFAAVDASLPKQPVRARSLLALVAQRADGEPQRRAHESLVARLADGGPGMAAARQAYLAAARYPEPADVPDIVRYRLIDHALARDDMELATELLADLTQAPPGVDAFGWSLLRARVLVLGGRSDSGVAVMEGILGDNPELRGAGLDRFLQVVFDLQGSGAHDGALQLLQRLALRDLPGQRQRELLYWQAESHEAEERYRRAAALYMRSATLVDGKGGDQWGQTARYQAARMLAKAGLVSDARRIYSVLLRVTQNDSRRSTLRHRLQQLGIRDAAPANLPMPEGEGDR